MAHILAIRFSALGDVAMTIPILYSFALQYPQHQLTVLSRDSMKDLFRHAPENLIFRGIDLKKYNGLSGLSRLYRELRAEHFDAVADLHDVLRTKYLRWRFRLSGVPVAHIDKGRREKRQLTAWKHKKLVPLTSSFQRYADVFSRLGYQTLAIFQPKPCNDSTETLHCFYQAIGEKGKDYWIGIAPFAAHRGKIYPLSQQEEVIHSLSASGNKKIFLFGGGKNERETLEAWAAKYPHVISVAGKLKMNEELLLMNRLDVMVSMDSGNMHLASLVGTPAVSIWGATHPYAGFMGWNQSPSNAVQTDLPCRPCSIYGNKPCRRGDYACLTQITPQAVLSKINAILTKQ